MESQSSEPKTDSEESETISNPALTDESSSSSKIQQQIVLVVILAILVLIIVLSIYAIATSGVFSEFDLLREIISDLRSIE